MKLFVGKVIRAAAISLLALQQQQQNDGNSNGQSLFQSGSEIVNFVKGRYEELHSTASIVRLKYSEAVSFSFEVPDGMDLDGVDVQSFLDINTSKDRLRVMDIVRSLHNNSTKPVVVYFPGLDGQGISAQQQFGDLSQTFEFWRMTITESEGETPFVELVGGACEFLDEVLLNDARNATIIGESFGGLVAPAVALRKPNLLSGMVLVNPATSFDDTRWSTLGPFLTSLRHLGNNNSEGSLPTPYSVIGGLALSLAIPDFTQLVSLVSIDLFISAQV